VLPQYDQELQEEGLLERLGLSAATLDGQAFLQVMHNQWATAGLLLCC
jgi:hypothetical protein